MADDDLDDQYLVRRAIEDINLGHEFHTVNNGSQLIDRLLHQGIYQDARNSLPDCIVLDLNMPLLDGFETLVEIKSHKGIRHIPVYVLSTSRSEKDRQRSLELGACGFYVKPTQFGELKRIVGDICLKTEQARLERQFSD